MTERWLWTQKQDVGPSPRIGPAMAYDAARQRVVLFGGRGGVQEAPRHNDTWTWDGRDWTQVADTGPPGRDSPGMVYDEARQRLVLFGGTVDANGGERPVIGDTWEWDGEYWTQVADIGPAPCTRFAMAYDKGRRHVVLFGGATFDESSSKPYLNDTWAWDGTDWTQIADTGPSTRRDSTMVFDSTRKCLVLFGGTEHTAPSDVLTIHNDTWEWGEDDAGWVQIQDIGPQDWFGTPKMVYTGKHTVLLASARAERGETWEWDGKVWTQRQNMGPTPPDRPGLAYDSQRDRAVLYGVLRFVGGGVVVFGDTWELAIVEQPPA